MHIIVDGYNLIRQSQSLDSLGAMDLQGERQALIELLAGYRRARSHRVTVVFDGTRAPALVQARDRVMGVQVVFSRRGETADAVIMRMAASERQGATVVSSDRAVARSASASGAMTIDSPAFEKRLMAAAYEQAKGLDREARETDAARRISTRKKGPSRRLSKKQRRQRRLEEKL